MRASLAFIAFASVVSLVAGGLKLGVAEDGVARARERRIVDGRTKDGNVISDTKRSLVTFVNTTSWDEREERGDGNANAAPASGRAETKARTGTGTGTGTGTSEGRERATREMFAKDKNAFFERFFASAFADVNALAGMVTSKKAMSEVCRRGGAKLSLYALKRESVNGFSWTHRGGTASFWSTNGLHDHIRAHVNEIARDFPKDFVEAYFLVNNFDEPQLLGDCPNLSELSRVHANIVPGVVNKDENVPVWSMATVRGCFKDLLVPFPDWFGHIVKPRPASVKPWSERSSDITFRGSTTGMGDAQTNMRARSIGILANETGFDVGLTAVIQNFNAASVRHLMKPEMQKSEFDNYKFLLDIDGNGHSFHRQLLIAEAKAALVRVNVFTDWIAGGLTDDEFCFDIDPRNVLESSRAVRDKLNSDLVHSETVARAFNELVYWMIDEDMATRYLRAAFTRYVTAVKFVD